MPANGAGYFFAIQDKQPGFNSVPLSSSSIVDGFPIAQRKPVYG
jgi:hypothetical protein